MDGAQDDQSLVVVHGTVDGWRIGNRAAYPRLESAAGSSQPRRRPVAAPLLDLTVPEYGPYQLVSSPQMEQGRAVKELRSGELVQVGVLPRMGSESGSCWQSTFRWPRGCWGGGCVWFGRWGTGRFAAIGSLATGIAPDSPSVGDPARHPVVAGQRPQGDGGQSL